MNQNAVNPKSNFILALADETTSTSNLLIPDLSKYA